MIDYLLVPPSLLLLFGFILTLLNKGSKEPLKLKISILAFVTLVVFSGNFALWALVFVFTAICLVNLEGGKGIYSAAVALLLFGVVFYLICFDLMLESKELTGQQTWAIRDISSIILRPSKSGILSASLFFLAIIQSSIVLQNSKPPRFISLFMSSCILNVCGVLSAWYLLTFFMSLSVNYLGWAIEIFSLILFVSTTTLLYLMVDKTMSQVNAIRFMALIFGSLSYYFFRLSMQDMAVDLNSIYGGIQ